MDDDDNKKKGINISIDINGQDLVFATLFGGLFIFLAMLARSLGNC